jgi:hypothetical protein
MRCSLSAAVVIADSGIAATNADSMDGVAKSLPRAAVINLPVSRTQMDH